MFVWSYRGVVFALPLCALFSYLTISSRYDGAEPWMDGAIFALMAFIFIRIWLE
jgi:hypothetical protein